MSPEAISVVIGIVTLVITVGITLATVSFRMGQQRQEIADLREDLARKADAADLSMIKESLAEIKGMFVLRLRE